MSRIRLYVKLFNTVGEYEADFTEITDYLEKIGNITVDSDSSGYDIGIYRNSDISITLNNREGLFADVGNPNTLFKFTRNNSIIKVTYDMANYNLTAVGAFSFQGEYVSQETTLYEGLLNDDSLVEDAKQASVSFRVLGFETLFQEKVNFAGFVLGDDIEDLIYKSLNITRITDLLTVSASNISVGLNQIPDAIESLENKTVKQVLDELLLLSNSIFQIRDRVVYVSPRTEGATLEFTFYGPQSATGIENIQELKNITSGRNKIFNFFKWQDSSQTAARNPSIRRYGTKIKELSSDLFTNTTKQFNIMESLLDEFGLPKKEMDITTDIGYVTLAINILDKVNVDYPLQIDESEGFDLPICGLAICGEAVLPKMIFAFSQSSETYFKVIKKIVSPEKRTITFRIREV